VAPAAPAAPAENRINSANRAEKSASSAWKKPLRRTTGTCAKHQRMVMEAIKRARQVALLPFVID